MEWGGGQSSSRQRFCFSFLTDDHCDQNWTFTVISESKLLKQAYGLLGVSRQHVRRKNRRQKISRRQNGVLVVLVHPDHTLCKMKLKLIKVWVTHETTKRMNVFRWFFAWKCNSKDVVYPLLIGPTVDDLQWPFRAVVFSSAFVFYVHFWVYRSRTDEVVVYSALLKLSTIQKFI